MQAPDGALFKDGQLVEHKLEGEFDADKLKLVLRTIRKRLDDGYEALWKLQEKPIAAWGKDANEERWAQRFAERYALITYGGPGQSYLAGAPGMRSSSPVSSRGCGR